MFVNGFSCLWSPISIILVGLHLNTPGMLSSSTVAASSMMTVVMFDAFQAHDIVDRNTLLPFMMSSSYFVVYSDTS